HKHKRRGGLVVSCRTNKFGAQTANATYICVFASNSCNDRSASPQIFSLAGIMQRWLTLAAIILSLAAICASNQPVKIHYSKVCVDLCKYLYQFAEYRLHVSFR